MAARWAPLYRTAYLLTGRPARGRGAAPVGDGEDLRALGLDPRQGRGRRLRPARDGARSWPVAGDARAASSPPTTCPTAATAAASTSAPTTSRCGTRSASCRRGCGPPSCSGTSRTSPRQATARELGVSVGSVKSQTHHALKRLRAALPELELHAMNAIEIRISLTVRLRRRRRAARRTPLAVPAARSAAPVVVGQQDGWPARLRRSPSWLRARRSRCPRCETDPRDATAPAQDDHDRGSRTRCRSWSTVASRVVDGDGLSGRRARKSRVDRRHHLGTGSSVLTAGRHAGPLRADWKRRARPAAGARHRYVTAYLDGLDAVVYEDYSGLIRCRGIAPPSSLTDSAPDRAWPANGRRRRTRSS